MKKGFKRKFKCGEYATIIKYVDDSNIDIRFSSGYVVRGITKQEFINRSITPPSLKKPPKVDYQRVKEKFEEKGYNLISAEYRGAREPLEYICPKHENKGVQKISWFNISQGRGCRDCGYERVSEALKEKKKKYSFSDVEDFFKSKMPDYTLVSKELDFENASTKIKFVCPKHKNITQEKQFQVLLTKPYCSLCSIENVDRNKIPFETVVKDFNDNGYVVISKEEEYKNAATKIEVLCSKHGNFFIRYGHLKEGKGCPTCGGETKREKLKKSFLDVVENINKEGFIVLSKENEYKSTTTKLKLECPFHKGKHFYSSYSHVVHSHVGCPLCNESKGERKIRLVLDKHNIKHIAQKRFKDLYRYHGKYLSYDFYIPSQKVLIEYQGEFHTTVTSWSTEEHLEDQQERDKLKLEYAEKNGFTLIQIWHWDYDNIEKILNEKGVI